MDIRYVIARDDPSAFYRAAELLRPYLRKAQYALAVLDFQWSHRFETSDRMRDQLRDQLEKNGWSGRCEVIVIDPMLEIWAWADLRALARAICDHAPKYTERIYEELRRRAFGKGKPDDPKKALEGLGVPGFKRDNAFYRRLANYVSREAIVRCGDPAFSCLRSALSSWLGPWPSSP